MAVRRTVTRIGVRLFRHTARTALDSVGAAADQLGRDSFRQVFTVTPPVTVYVYAAHSRVTIRRRAGNQVELEATMRGAFGMNLAIDQDDAGIYIVAKRKPVAGALAWIDFTLSVPPEARILAHLTPGRLVLNDIDGLIEAAPIRPPESMAS